MTQTGGLLRDGDRWWQHWSLTVRGGTLLRLTDTAGLAPMSACCSTTPRTRSNATTRLTPQGQNTFKLTKGTAVFRTGRIFCSSSKIPGVGTTGLRESHQAVGGSGVGDRSYQLYRNDWTQNGT